MSCDAESLPNFVDESFITSLLAKAAGSSASRIGEVTAKAREARGLDLEDVAVLLQAQGEEHDAALFAAAKSVKQAIYGKRIVLFAPLYITSECGNQCVYCGFNASNTALQRRTLDSQAIRAEVKALERMGHKRLLLVYGEHPRFDAGWIAETVQTVYETTSEKSGVIRRVNINCAPQSVEGFRTLRQAGIGTYQCFQETYHRTTYEQMHPAGRKRTYLWRLYAMHRALEAGIDDVGMGMLLGLYDYRFEILALLKHAATLEARFGVGPHTLSFPRLEPALNADIAFRPPHAVRAEELKRVVAILRLALPYAGLILSTRESAAMRQELLELGVSQASAGSRTYPGAYSEASHDCPDVQQFCVDDTRSLDDIIGDLASHGYLPSWCTACYRSCRTGGRFMALAKSGAIQKFCHPNALLTFSEYLHDYASAHTLATGRVLMEKELDRCPEHMRSLVRDALSRVEAGERDIYF